MIKTKTKRYRMFIGYTQEQMAKEVGMPLGSYRAKEQGRVHFNDQEKIEVKKVISHQVPNITIDDIFFEV